MKLNTINDTHFPTSESSILVHVLCGACKDLEKVFELHCIFLYIPNVDKVLSNYKIYKLQSYIIFNTCGKKQKKSSFLIRVGKKNKKVTFILLVDMNLFIIL